MRVRRTAAELVAVLCVILALGAPAAAQEPPTAPDPKTPPPQTTNGKPDGNGKDGTGDQIPQPPLPDKLKSFGDKVRKSALVQRLQNHGDGFYPRAFSLTTGASWSAGAGYRRHILDDRAVFDSGTEFSIRGYRLVETSIEFPSLPNRLYFRGDARYRHFPQEDFFGIAGASREPLRSTYLLQTGEVWSTVGMRVLPKMTAGVELGWLDVNVGRGTDGNYPIVQDLFDVAAVPGLYEQPNYLRTGVFWDYDRRDEPKYPRSGTRYRAGFNDYRDLTLDRYSFKRFDAEMSAFMPVMADRDVIALRGRLTYANNKPGHIVPFYMLPTMGGGTSLRAFDEFRYRAENALLVNGEYRWGVHKFVDVAFFGDAGKVSNDYQGINPKGLIANYGVGLRLHTATRGLFRFDIAHGREGTRFLAKVNQPF